MRRGSKYNPYECPACGYKTTRKANLKAHMARMHDLVIPTEGYSSQREWVWASRRSLIEKYAQADTATAKHMWATTLPAFAKRFGEQLGYFTFVGMMGEALKERRKRQEEV